jgi:hypothetical protein
MARRHIDGKVTLAWEDVALSEICVWFGERDGGPAVKSEAVA